MFLLTITFSVCVVHCSDDTSLNVNLLLLLVNKNSYYVNCELHSTVWSYTGRCHTQNYHSSVSFFCIFAACLKIPLKGSSGLL